MGGLPDATTPRSHDREGFGGHAVLGPGCWDGTWYEVVEEKATSASEQKSRLKWTLIAALIVSEGKRRYSDKLISTRNENAGAMCRLKSWNHYSRMLAAVATIKAFFLCSQEGDIPGLGSEFAASLPMTSPSLMSVA